MSNLYYKLTIAAIDADSEEELDEMLVYNMRENDGDATIAPADLAPALVVLTTVATALTITLEGESHEPTTQH